MNDTERLNLTKDDFFGFPSPIFIHCPSPFFLQQTLQLLAWQREASRETTVLCTDTYSTAEFLKLQAFANVDIRYLPSPPPIRFRNPWSLIQCARDVRQTASQLVATLGSGTLVYFGAMGQLVPGKLIYYASRNANLVYAGVPEHDLRLRETRSIKRWLHLKAVEWVTGCPHVYASRGDTATYANLIVHDASKIREKCFSISLDHTLLQTFNYRCHSVLGRRRVLFLERKDEDVYINYRNVVTSALAVMRKAGFTIYLKPHPRVGYSSFLKEHVDVIVPSFIPSEFLDISIFDGIMTNYSTGIRSAFNANKPGIILERMYERKNEADRKYTLNMLSNPEYFDGQMPPFEFPDSLEEFRSCFAGLPQNHSYS
jgi:hypothetical protein